MPEQTRPCRPQASVLVASQNGTPPKPHKRLSELFVRRYRGLPPWVLLAQLFLASGWLRAVAAHGIDSGWWNGSAISEFRVDYQDLSIEWYRSTMMDGPVAEWPAVIGIIVFAVQLIVALMLALNVRPLVGLALGAGLNVNLVLAGAVNPSIFYLIIGAALALWHVDTSVGPTGARRLTAASTLLGAAALGALVPEIGTIDPAFVIEDPAIVLSFFALLWVGALRVELSRESVQSKRPGRRGPGDKAVVGAVRKPAGGGSPLIASRDLRCERTK